MDEEELAQNLTDEFLAMGVLRVVDHAPDGEPIMAWNWSRLKVIYPEYYPIILDVVKEETRERVDRHLLDMEYKGLIRLHWNEDVMDYDVEVAPGVEIPGLNL